MSKKSVLILIPARFASTRFPGKPLALIAGSEDEGISNDLLRVANHLAKIPMSGKIESLNVSVAAGVILYEAVRQRFI